jgi:hypothetical protein
MTRPSASKRVQVVSALVEGSNINFIVRMTRVAQHTVLEGISDHVWATEELANLLETPAAN